MAESKNQAVRMKMLIENYIEAKLAGSASGYDICQADPEDYEHYYLLIQPKNGVYKGHSYILELKTTYGSDKSQYPLNPPYAHFSTDVFHTNISPNGGSICVDILKDKTKWMPSYSFDMIVQNILILFDEPNNASPYNSDASRVWMDCKAVFKQRRPELGKNASVQAVDELQDECFKPFSARAEQTMQRNNMKLYHKYFPQLIGDKKMMEERKKEFDEVFERYNAVKARRKKVEPVTEKSASDSSTDDKPVEKVDKSEKVEKVDKSARWKKYQKPTEQKTKE